MEQKQKAQVISKEEIIAILSKNGKDNIISSQTKKVLNAVISDKTGQELMISIINERKDKLDKFPLVIDGFVYQEIMASKNKSTIKELMSNLPNGVLKLKNSMELDYQPLQNLLINKKFKEADELTQNYLCQIVEKKKNKRKKWLYFTDIQFIPKNDLLIIDLLWRIYSEGKFGFSVQKKIWLVNSKKWDKLWKKISWLEINSGMMKRYPKGFLWTTEAPEGHLPLFNQLRGTQSLTYLFKRIDW
ncbi:MAG: GUN4 domain-containing protein [Cyanobacteria bacterium P01_H01_bin.35]